MKICESDSVDASACKWSAPGGHCRLTVPGCRLEIDRPVAPIERALATQVGGGHYKDMVIQPVEFVHKNGIGYMEGSVIKYVSRWRKKNGVEDLKKARRFLDLLIEMEGT